MFAQVCMQLRLLWTNDSLKIAWKAPSPSSFMIAYVDCDFNFNILHDSHNLPKQTLMLKTKQISLMTASLFKKDLMFKHVCVQRCVQEIIETRQALARALYGVPSPSFMHSMSKGQSLTAWLLCVLRRLGFAGGKRNMIMGHKLRLKMTQTEWFGCFLGFEGLPD